MPETMSIKERIRSEFPAMVKVEGGSFQMGSTKSSREQPVHEVSVKDFYLGQFPITNHQYFAFLMDYQSDTVKGGEHAGQRIIDEDSWSIQKFEGNWQVAQGFEDHPMIYVSWYGAVEYCNWLSEKTGEQYRLPSEAEWEYAASGGSKTEGLPFAGSHKLKEVGWFRINSHGQTKPVGLKLPNGLGLYDMNGNVREWCADHWHDNYDGAPTDGSAWVTGGDASRRVVRGGSWLSIDDDCRVSNRYSNYADYSFNNIGFRVARY